MTRTIKASEVKPGMTIQFDLDGWDIKGTVGTVNMRPYAAWIYTEKWREMSLNLDTPVTVLSEPAPVQPEEPTEFGARVVVDGRRFLLASEGEHDDQPWLEENEGVWWEWYDLINMGPVQVVPDQGWAVPADTPEVPERIEIGEWPVDDDDLKAYRWRDRFGSIWHSERRALDFPDLWVTYLRGPAGRVETTKPTRGPWTRVSDA